MKKPVIALHKDELKSINISVEPMSSLQETELDVHRDDHYMFIIQWEGDFVCELDFNEVRLSGPSICFVAPGQVHRYIEHDTSKGWLVFAEPELLPNQVRELFDACHNIRQAAPVTEDDAVFKIMPLLLEALLQKTTPLQKTMSKSLAGVLTAMCASRLAEVQNSQNLIGGQKYNTVARFKKLVINNCKSSKQVKDYAAQLNITPLHLNEMVKEITGFPASYWIQEEIVLEAKRLLYYSVLDIKQIAHELGYDDHAYFSRFFKKNAGLTASEFRKSKKPLFVQS